MVNNYQKLLNISYRHFLSIVIIFLILLFLSIYIAKNSLYEKLDLKGVSDGENLLVMVPIDNSDTFIDKAILKINNKEEKFTLNSISELNYDATNNINYQIYNISIDKKYPLNKIVNLTFYYNKEKIYKKVLKFIKE